MTFFTKVDLSIEDMMVLKIHQKYTETRDEQNKTTTRPKPERRRHLQKEEKNETVLLSPFAVSPKLFRRREGMMV
jgi:hypothetical protein